MSKFVSIKSLASFSLVTRYRRSIATGALINDSIPIASNMREVTWDNELADLAELWASQCFSVIDTQRKVLFGDQPVSVSFINCIFAMNPI